MFLSHFIWSGNSKKLDSTTFKYGVCYIDSFSSWWYLDRKSTTPFRPSVVHNSLLVERVIILLFRLIVVELFYLIRLQTCTYLSNVNSLNTRRWNSTNKMYSQSTKTDDFKLLFFVLRCRCVVWWDAIFLRVFKALLSYQFDCLGIWPVVCSCLVELLTK